MTIARRAGLFGLAALMMAGVGLGLNGAQAKPKLTAVIEDNLYGVWSFDGSCRSGDAMGIFKDKSAWIDEGYKGTWSLKGRVIELKTHYREPGTTGKGPGEPATWRLTVVRLTSKRLSFRYEGKKELRTARLCRRTPYPRRKR